MRGASSLLFCFGTAIYHFGGSAHARDHHDAATAAGTTSNGLCEVKTVNYITHTLPQQCLRTNWSSSISTSGANITEPATSDTPTAESGGTATTDDSRQNTEQKEGEDFGGEEEKEKRNDDAADKEEELETSSFMSFEEWKALQLKKQGQDPAEIEARKRRERKIESDQGGNNVIDGLGDDNEIIFDFNALNDKVSEITASATAASTDSKDHEKSTEVLYEDGDMQYYRSKDAGKTCKERFSYTSFDAGATILKSNPGAKNAKSILREDKDSYMLLTCGEQNKYVIIEMSEDILVDTVVLANYEFFSSMIRSFRVSVSARFPTKQWKELGTFEARNSRDIQPFLITHPGIWAKYIRVEFLSHYGNEYYCPVSLLRVHGTRMLDSWKDSEAGRDEDEDEAIDSSLPAETEEALQEHSGSHEGAGNEQIEANEDAEASNDAEVGGKPAADNITAATAGLSPWYSFFHTFDGQDVCQTASPTIPVPSNVSPYAASTEYSVTSSTLSEPHQTDPPSSGSSLREYMSSTSIPVSASPASLLANASLADTAPPSYASNTTLTESAPAPSSSSSSSPSSTISQATSTEPPSPAQSTSSGSSLNLEKPSIKSSSSTGISKDSQSSVSSSSSSSPSSSSPSSTSNSNAASAQQNPSSSSAKTTYSSSSSSSNIRTSSTASSKNRTSTSAHSSASPPVQESFFKSITKRLQLLESNTSLSLQYIEDQSRFLQDALTKMERKQISRVDAFLDTLNQTVLSELRSARAQADQIWQGTVIALETQREQSQREIVALSERMAVLADEVVFQKRMAILQSVLLLSCLALVIFSRGLSGTSFDLALYSAATNPNSFLAARGASSPPQSMATAATSAAAEYGTPSPSPPSLRRAETRPGSPPRPRVFTRSSQ